MIYLHVPFCRSFCTYCGFYSEVCSKARQDRFFSDYESAVLREIRERESEIRENIESAEADSLYIGGGTPSVLPLPVLSRLVSSLATFKVDSSKSGGGREGDTGKSLPDSAQNAPEDKSSSSFCTASGPLPFTEPRAATPVSPSLPSPLADTSREMEQSLTPFRCREFTVEVNPEDIIEKGEDYVHGLLALGVNRISMGVQSFDDRILRWMNRRHNAEKATQAYCIIRRAALEAHTEISVSIDLIFGLSQLSDSLWNDTISKALALGRSEGIPRPEHISAYQLSIEEGSALEKLIGDGKYTEAPEEQCRHQYDTLCSRLKEAGYHHYEVSNFAIPGHEAVHNSAYWRRVPYVGLGPGAHSFRIEAAPDGRHEFRSWNSPELPHIGYDGELKTYSSETETLDPEDIRIERIMLPMRTDAGMPEEELRSLADGNVIDSLLEEGALERKQGRICIPESHFFTSDEIIRELV